MMRLGRWRYRLAIAVLALIAVVVLAGRTISAMKPVPESFHTVLSDSTLVQILDRHGNPLNTTYQNNWNIHDTVGLHEVPEFLRTAFMRSEDRRFYQHHGPDWQARAAALLSNLKAWRAVRGASTITEQVVRMINPRPRTVWSRWLEGFEAGALEARYNKDDIFEFYLNQVPYSANRRGVVQAAHYYFNRDLDTLSKKEMLALVVLVRSPSRYDLWKKRDAIESAIARLALQLEQQGLLSSAERTQLLSQSFELEAPQLEVQASEFVRYVKQHPLIQYAGWPHVRTTLDGALQQRVQTLLDNRLTSLQERTVHNGAVLVVDHQSSEILAWVVAGKTTEDTPGRFIDAVSTPRQPGSAMKPLLYALALSRGWSAATVIDDAPLTESVGNGLHSYQNYSRHFYGPVSLRQALANSLNIPALKTLQFVGSAAYLSFLNELGFHGLSRHPDFYGDGLALGNGEVSLFDLVQAYSALANQGEFRPLQVFSEALDRAPAHRVLPAEVASLVSNILSDAGARSLEFGSFSVLNLPVQTAVKTGTSSDYRDSWALGYNYRYTVGVWMGNLDQQATDGISGSIGPALVLRSIFAELNQHQQTRALPIHRSLVKQELCLASRQLKSLDEDCESYTEWFVPGTEPRAVAHPAEDRVPIRLRRPAYDLHLAYDPRLPAASQAFEFFIQGVEDSDQVDWNINGAHVQVQGGRYVWPLQRGRHEVAATVWRAGDKIAQLDSTRFWVK